MATPQSRIGRTKQLLASSKQIPHLWMTILENIVPGFSAILSFYRDALGIDVTSLLSAAVVVFGIFRYGSTIYDGILGWASHYCTRSIIIPSEEGVYDNVLTWMTKHKLSRTSTSLRLNEWTAQMNEDHKRLTKSGADSHVKFDEWDAYVWYDFEPLSGSYWVWHKRNLFIFDKRQWEMGSQYIELRCVGFSTVPIKELIDECAKESFNDRETMTAVTRPVLKDDTAYWGSFLARPVRPLDSVIMDSKEKVRVIADINEYLLKSTQRWYNRRGIPHRRGYFFHGAPGTGKTSFSYAIAGYFGIPIFTLSLLDSKLTEGKLSQLFNILCDRCVLLMEDIDSVGFEKRDDPTYYENNKRDGDREAEKKISLSAFLNAIDGASSHEGRILIMTSNYPERLDPALVRPGRVDVWVEFKLATRDQIQDLFMHIYAPSTPAISEVRWYYGRKKTRVNPDEDRPLMSREELLGMAKEFASKLPEGELSPARIQGFLLTRKREPRRALDEVDELIKEHRASREYKNKVAEQPVNVVQEIQEQPVNVVQEIQEPILVNGIQSQPEVELVPASLDSAPGTNSMTENTQTTLENGEPRQEALTNGDTTMGTSTIARDHPSETLTEEASTNGFTNGDPPSTAVDDPSSLSHLPTKPTTEEPSTNGHLPDSSIENDATPHHSNGTQTNGNGTTNGTIEDETPSPTPSPSKSTLSSLEKKEDGGEGTPTKKKKKRLSWKRISSGYNATGGDGES